MHTWGGQVPWLANAFAQLVVAFAPWLRRRADQALADSLLGSLLPGLSAAPRYDLQGGLWGCDPHTLAWLGEQLPQCLGRVHAAPVAEQA